MVKLLILIISNFILCDLSRSSNVDCDYNFVNYAGLNSVYTCIVRKNLNIISKDGTLIESATGYHRGSSSNIDVFAFEAENKKIEYFPKGLEKIFQNLKGIYIQNGRLKEIQQSDFRGYSELLYLELNNNDIEVLEDGVFDFIPSIATIWLPGNKIIHVGENVFTNLNKLSYFGIIKNTCINYQTNDFQTQSFMAMNNLKENCFDQNFSKLSTKLKNIEEDAKNLRSDNFYIFSQSLEKLEKELKTSKFSYLTSFKERFHILKFVTPETAASQSSCLTSKFEDLEASLKVAIIKTLDENLQKFQIGSCQVIDERIRNDNLDLDKSFNDLMTKMRETDTNVNSKFEELVNFPTAISKRIGKFECDQMHFAKSELHSMKQVNVAENIKFKKLEERIGKIEENIEKIMQALNVTN